LECGGSPPLSATNQPIAPQCCSSTRPALGFVFVSVRIVTRAAFFFHVALAFMLASFLISALRTHSLCHELESFSSNLLRTNRTTSVLFHFPDLP
jgi:hypothetical protein